jgi:hypothetical protein
LVCELDIVRNTSLKEKRIETSDIAVSSQTDNTDSGSRCLFGCRWMRLGAESKFTAAEGVYGIKKLISLQPASPQFTTPPLLPLPQI